MAKKGTKPSEFVLPGDLSEQAMLDAPLIVEGLLVVKDAVNGHHAPSGIVPAHGEDVEARISSRRTDSSKDSTEISWKEMKKRERLWHVISTLCRVVALLVLLYLFICSLDVLASAFRLLGGAAAGEVMSDSRLLSNPVSGLMIGVMATVLLQSSSTSTSILVSMVASGMVTVKIGIPMVMGANIGTSLTNTLVSVAHAGKRDEFRRAFAGATIHDMFNWLSVLILLPIEASCGYLYKTTSLIVGNMDGFNMDKKPPKLLKVLTEPLTKGIIQLDKKVIKKIAMNQVAANESVDLIKHYCGGGGGAADENGTVLELAPKFCSHIFAGTMLPNSTVGIILLFASLAVLVTCLISIVKVLHTLLHGQVASAVHRIVNSDLPFPFTCLTGYFAIIVGALLTILLQSSSVFTSALTPLVGVGVLTLDRMYPLTLGANVGTTFTSILAALASPPSSLPSALQISLCHFFFNVSGIAIFYPIPFMRRVPLQVAESLGNVTAKYRWFVIVYVVFMFVVLPGFILSLSMMGPTAMLAVGVPILVVAAAVVVMNVIQAKARDRLPVMLQNWNFLPLPLHSLKPWDRLFTGCCTRFDPVASEGRRGLDGSESRSELLASMTMTKAKSLTSSN